MQIDVGNNKPFKTKPYRTPIKSREVVDKAINEMLDANVIKKSRSPWSYPVVIVDKDGSKRVLCRLQKAKSNNKEKFLSLAVIDDILALLGKAKYFISLDLKSGYWQVAMDEKDKEKTAFVCHKGLFEFNEIPLAFQTLLQYFKN